VEFHRSQHGYGWWIFFGKRVRWCSTKATTAMWPRIIRGADENCNRAITIVLWPLGSLDIWWELRWRTDEDGTCDECQAWMDEIMSELKVRDVVEDA
jgi:hypothetical protein